MILKVYWTVVETVAADGEVLRTSEEYSYAPIGACEDYTPIGLRVRRQASGPRWAAIEVDWSGPPTVEEALFPAELLGMARSGVAGFRLVDAGIGSGLSPAVVPPPMPRPRPKPAMVVGLDQQQAFGWYTPGRDGSKGVRCRT